MASLFLGSVVYGTVVDDTCRWYATAHSTKLVRDGANLRLIYIKAFEWNPDTIYYSHFTGGVWSSPEIVGRGRGCGLALDVDGNPCVVYDSTTELLALGPGAGSRPRKWVLSLRRRISGNWTDRVELTSLSTVGDVYPSDATIKIKNNIVHILINRNLRYCTPISPVSRWYGRYWKLCYGYCPITATGPGDVNWTVLDSLPPDWFNPKPTCIYYPEPSMTIDANGYPHIVYGKGDGDGEAVKDGNNDIYYTEWTGTEWSTPFNISETPDIDSKEPYIEYIPAPIPTVTVVWSEEDEVKLRGKNLETGWWDPLPAKNVSNTPAYYSGMPHLTENAEYVVWGEHLADSTYQIFYRKTDLSSAPKPATDDPAGWNLFPQAQYKQAKKKNELYIAYTRRPSDGGDIYTRPCSVMCITIVGVKAGSYYDVDCGLEDASPYCLEREGYIQYPEHSVDYSATELKYRLPHLNPDYDYELEVIGHHEEPIKGNQWNSQVKADGEMARVLKLKTGVPDTVSMIIPLSCYKDDQEVILTAKRLTGDFASVEKIILYQYERIGGTGGAQCAGSGKSSITHLRIFPNPLTQSATIKYELTTPSHITLRVYDVTGRAVRTLIDAEKQSGIKTVNWDGKDDYGREVSNGIYFCRLQTDNSTEAKKVIVLR